MALPRGLVSGQGLTWVGPTLDDEAGLLVRPGERGVFVDYDGHRPGDGYVVEFPGGRVFCCRRSDVEPDPRPPVPVHRTHSSKVHRA